MKDDEGGCDRCGRVVHENDLHPLSIKIEGARRPKGQSGYKTLISHKHFCPDCNEDVERRIIGLALTVGGSFY